MLHPIFSTVYLSFLILGPSESHADHNKEHYENDEEHPIGNFKDTNKIIKNHNKLENCVTYIGTCLQLVYVVT